MWGPHEITAMSYAVIGTIFLTDSLLMLRGWIRAGPQAVVEFFLRAVQDWPPKFVLLWIVGNMWLLGVFIFACALDHFWDRHYLAVFEMLVSTATAVIIAAQWLGFRIVALWRSTWRG